MLSVVQFAASILRSATQLRVQGISLTAAKVCMCTAKGFLSLRAQWRVLEQLYEVGQPAGMVCMLQLSAVHRHNWLRVQRMQVTS